jgi:hypothetical protein
MNLNAVGIIKKTYFCKIFSIILRTNLLDHESTHYLERFYNIALKVIVIFLSTTT